MTALALRSITPPCTFIVNSRGYIVLTTEHPTTEEIYFPINKIGISSSIKLKISKTPDEIKKNFKI